MTHRNPLHRRLTALIAVLILSACGQKQTDAARNDEAPPMENGVYVAQGICFGEGGCPFKHWRVGKPVELHERLDPASPVVATLKPGEWVEPLEGQLRFVPQRGVVRTAHDLPPVSDGTKTHTPRLEVGDVVYQLEFEGEGEGVLWRRGERLTWQEPETPEEEAYIAWDAASPGPPAPPDPTLGMWRRLRRENGGQTGWTQDTDFECMGPLAGDDNCRD
jgi:hypothetical protein